MIQWLGCFKVLSALPQDQSSVPNMKRTSVLPMTLVPGHLISSSGLHTQVSVHARAHARTHTHTHIEMDKN